MYVLHSRTVQKSSLLMFWNVPSLNEVVQSIEICGSINQYKKSICTYTIKRVSMGWWLLRLSAKILALLRLSINFFQLRLTRS